MFGVKCTIVFVLAFDLFAFDVIVLSNIDALINIQNLKENEMSVVDVIGGEEQVVSLGLASENDQVKVDAESKNSLFEDLAQYQTSFRASVKLATKWEDRVYQTGDIVSFQGKNWRAKWYAKVTDIPGAGDPWVEDNSLSYYLDIELAKREHLPSDSAFVPLTVNRLAVLKAIPISVFEGELPQTIEYSLEPFRNHTISLPVVTNSTPVQNIDFTSDNFTISQSNGNHTASIPSLYYGGTVYISSLNGRQIGHFELTSPIENRISIWGVASGVYIFQMVSPNGVQQSHKIMHSGGDFALAASFTGGSDLGESVTHYSRKSRSSSAQYRFELYPTQQNYRDTSVILNPIQGENGAVDIIFETKPANVETLLNEETYNAIFPHRYGLGSNQDDGDFYTYSAFKEAIETLSKYRATIYTKHLVGGDRVVVEYENGSTNTYYTGVEYDMSSNPETSTIVDYSTLLNWGTPEEVRYELVAMLAHMGSETTGRSPGATDQWEYGLYFVHELGLGAETVGEYTSAHDVYPPEPGESYHGRGPKQLSYNYNYGQFSDFLYADKNVILKNPNLISEDAVVSFMSSLWFWMTPQTEKPSCHMIMSGEWIPTSEDTAMGRAISKFGMTTNVINGGVECGASFSVINNEKRLGHYNFFANLMGVDPEDELSCRDITHY